MFWTRTVLLAWGYALCATLCAAQTTADVRRDAQVHLGPLYLTPRFAMKEFGVDSNVFNNAQPRRDFTFTFAPRADVWLPFGRRALLTAAAGTDVVYYQRYATERSLNPEIRVRGEVFLGRVTPFAEVGYLRTRQRPNLEIDARSLRQERLLKAGVDVQLSSKVSAEIAADHKPVTFAAGESFNDVNLQETLNRTTATLGVVGRYAITPLTTIVFRAESASDRFEFSPLRNADSTRILPGVEFKPRALISGSAHVGFRRFSPLDRSLERFSGVVAASSLSYTLRGSTKFTVTADRDLTYSYERVQPYFVVDAYGFTVRRQIVGSFDITGGVQRQKYSYRELLLPGAIPADLDRVDVTRTWFSSIGYRVIRTMRAGFR